MKVLHNKVGERVHRNARFIIEHLQGAGLACTVHGSDDALWHEAVIDSRLCGEGSFFVGLRGEVHNGGDFALQAVRCGVRVVLVEHAYAGLSLIEELTGLKGALICVEDALLAFEVLARSVRMREGRNTAVIGVTGSAGKTTTKEMLRAVLGATGNEGNFNTVQGLCMSILNAQWVTVDSSTHAKVMPTPYAVFECGISYEDEMSHLVRVLQPDYALITNVGSAHLGHFSLLSRLQDEKLAIASSMGAENVLWVPDDDEVLLRKAQGLACMVRTHGFASCAGFTGVVDKGIVGSILKFENGRDITLHMPGAVNARNALSVLALADFFFIPREESAVALEQCSGIARRYEVVSKRPLIVDDSYNANTGAMIEAIRWFVKNAGAPYVLVLGGMKELGAHGEREHQCVVNALGDALMSSSIAACDVHVVLVGFEYAGVSLPPAYHEACVRVENATEARECVRGVAAKNARRGVGLRDLSVLIKGSRAYALDKMAHYIISLAQECDYKNADTSISMHTGAVN